jgi:hypothetical protein
MGRAVCLMWKYGSRRVWSVNRGCLLLHGTWPHLWFIQRSVYTYPLICISYRTYDIDYCSLFFTFHIRTPICTITPASRFSHVTFLACYVTLLARYDRLLACYDTLLLHYVTFFARYDTLFARYVTLLTSFYFILFSYAFRPSQYASCTLRYASCMLRYASHKLLTRLHASNTFWSHFEIAWKWNTK